MTTAIKSDYGTTYPGIVNGNLWRTDRYVSDEDGSEHFNLTKVAHRGDVSRTVCTYTNRDKYSANCPCCYLNQPHSIEYHAQAIAMWCKCGKTFKQAGNGYAGATHWTCKQCGDEHTLL